MKKHIRYFVCIPVMLHIYFNDVMADFIITENVPNSCNNDILKPDETNTAYFTAIYEPIKVSCSPGSYLKKQETTCEICPNNFYCGGGDFFFSETDDQGIIECPNKQKSPRGAKTENDCGVIMHIGEYGKIYLQQDKRTPVSFTVKVGNKIYYANMALSSTKKLKTSQDSKVYLHIMRDGKDYVVYDSSMQ